MRDFAVDVEPNNVESWVHEVFQVSLTSEEWTYGCCRTDVSTFLTIRKNYFEDKLSAVDAYAQLTGDIFPSNLSIMIKGIGVIRFRASQASKTDTKSNLRELVERDSATKPYKAIQLALLFLVREEMREELLGDLEELFVAKHKEFGPSVANAWYVKECALSLWPQFQNWLLRIGAISFLIEIWHRIMGR